LGPYKILESLGRGGMGEVFLAYDPICARTIALKRIRPELNENPTIRSRFLREAKVASALAHPSIIPILSIETGPPEIYYTMPYVEGDTLRQILRLAREQEKNGGPLHPIGSSIPALSRIFLQVCEAMAYTHSKGVLHRDLKPENIIIGKYGEVMILDWGIADFIDRLESDESLPEMRPQEKNEDLTRPGKITGTLAYMAPERLKGQSSSVQTDLYALGVILYQLLTLQLPFQRKTIATFRKRVESEQMVDPAEMAPYREIPRQLAEICNKCLAKDPQDRFQSVEKLIVELKKFIEGRPEWMFVAELQLKRKTDWQFQENVLLAKHLAITQGFNVTQWAELSVSKASFADNMCWQVEVKMAQKGEGIGFLLNVPSTSLEEGYSLWIGSEANPSCKLFRNNVQVIEDKELFLSPKTWHTIRIEKIDDYLKFFLDGELKLSFASHLPLPGKHVGILAKDDRFELRECKVFDASNNAMVGCLAVPNAFLSHRLFDVALEEYRRIGHGFPGRVEGREALFRAGLTMLEKAKIDPQFFPAALKEFENLYRTSGAPLEYLGKSLVYQAMEDGEEEAKCLELALRKFPKHPLLSILKEHIVYRMHESSLNDREAAYRIILLAIRHIPDLLNNPDTRGLLKSLKANWEPLPFIEEDGTDPLTETAIILAFWLAKVPILTEIARGLLTQTPVPTTLLCNVLHCLLELDSPKEVKLLLQEISEDALPMKNRRLIAIALLTADEDFERASKEALKIVPVTKQETRTLLYLLRNALKKKEPAFARKLVLEMKKKKLPLADKSHFDAIEIWSLLLENKWKEAAAIFAMLPASVLTHEQSPLHFPYGSWLYAAQGSKMGLSHFSGVLDTTYPPTTALPSYFLTGRMDEKKGWIEHAFWWEKKELHRQIDLFYKVIGKSGEKTKNS
jgi:serine/threonine-protein kinase